MEILTMRNKEVDRLKAIQQVLEKKLSWRAASEQLGLSMRQIGNLCMRVRAEGNRGIIHKLRGRASNHQLAPKRLEKALALVEKRYADFGPTLANEKLAEKHRIKLSTSVLRQGMIGAGLWKPKRGGGKHRAWRARRGCVGELIQLDGSPHDWFEGRGAPCFLIS